MFCTGVHPHTLCSRVAHHVCVRVCDGALSPYECIPQSHVSALAALPSNRSPPTSHPQTPWLRAERAGYGNEVGTVCDPHRTPIGQNVVNVMDGVKRQPLAQSPNGDEMWPPQPGCPENEEVEDLEGNQRTILGAQPFVRLANSWMHLCVWRKPASI